MKNQIASFFFLQQYSFELSILNDILFDEIIKL